MPSSNPHRTHIILLYALAVVSSVAMLADAGGAITSYDTASYIDAWERFEAGFPDVDRTPVYPAFLAFCRFVAGKGHMLTLAVVLQNAISWISLWFFYKIAIRATGSERVAFYLSVIIAILPAFAMWHCHVLTESLAVSGSIFFVYSFLSFYDGKPLWHALGVFFWLMFLIFLRPAFIYLLPVTGVALLLMAWQKKQLWRRTALGLGAVIVTTAAILMYMVAYKQHYGVFAVSKVSLYNNFFNMRKDGLLEPAKTDNVELRNYIEQSYKEKGRGPNKLTYADLFMETNYVVLEHWDMPTVTKLVDGSRGENPKAELISIARRMNLSAHENLLDTLYVSPKTPFDMLNMKVGWVYLLLTVYFSALCISIRRTKQIDWCCAMFLMMGASNLIVAVLGSMAEYGRLIVPSKFIYLLMLAQLLYGRVGNMKELEQQDRIKV